MTVWRLGSPSSRWILALWLAWFALLAALAAYNLRREWQRQTSARVSIDSPSPGPVDGKDLKVSPEQHTDFVYSVVVDNEALLKGVLVLLGPPGILTAIWLYVRRRREPGPPT